MQSPDRLGSEPIGKLLWSMGVQASFSVLLYSIYSLTDTYFIARGVDAFAAGGVSLAGPILLALGACSTTIGAGGASVISRALGNGDKETAASCAANSFLVFWILALAVTFLGLLFLDPLLMLLGATPGLLPYARDYARILLIGAVTSTGFSNLIRAEGNTRYSVYIWVYPVLLNVLLDPLFIFGLKMGVKGAALATVCSQSLSAGMSIYYFFFSKARKATAYKISLRHFQLRKSMIGEILLIGFPSFLSQMSSSISIVLVNNMLGLHGGDEAISAYSIVSRIYTLLMFPQTGIVHALQPILGYNYGKKNWERVKEAIRLAMAAAAVYGALIMGVGIFGGRLLTGIFIEEVLVRSMAVTVLFYLVLSAPLKGAVTIVSASFQAMGKALPAAILPVAGIAVIQYPLLQIMGNTWGLQGIWTSFPLADALTFTTAILLFIYYMKKIRRADQP